MKLLAAACIVLLFSAGASACPMAAGVEKQYGVGFGGFLSPIPRADALKGGPFRKFRLAESNLVSDGFRHTLLVDQSGKQAWIRRSGGFAGVSELYGPIDVSAFSLEGCGSGADKNALPPDLIVHAPPAPRVPGAR